jgi:hypothetical protein
MDWKDFLALVAIPAFGVVGGLAWVAYSGLQQFRIEVAQKYASVAYLKDVEDRLVKMVGEVKTSVEKLDAKIERLLDRGGD